MIRGIATAAVGLALVAGQAAAFSPEFPAQAAVTFERIAPDAVRLPVGGYDAGDVETVRIAGQVRRVAWTIAQPALTTFQLLAPLRRQILAEGYEIAFECADLGCGGFDFRFAVNWVAEPAMHVDLGDFRYLLARKGETRAVALLVSRAPEAGFVQMVEVAPKGPNAPRVVTSTKSVDEGAAAALAGAGLSLGEEFNPAARDSVGALDQPAAKTGGDAADIGIALERTGAAPLEDLLFATGSSSLAEETYGSLRQLADYLESRPDRALTLVGHTDDEGPLAVNIALSKQRAQSVRTRLVRDYGVAADRLRAEGVGFLAPRASNRSDDGRLANRRVEAILTP